MDRIKAIVARLKAWYEDLVARWGLLAHVIATLDRYNHRRGNAYAAAISFIGILSLVPVMMVSFAIAAFVLVWNPTLLTDITDAIVEHVPGALGEQLNSVIDSAIASRRTVGVIGLISAALAGIGWMTLMRNGLTEMWGGRVKRNAVLAKVYDLGTFAVLGLLFLTTIAMNIVSTGPLGRQILEFVGIPDSGVTSFLLKASSVIIAVSATWVLFIVVLAWMPRCAVSVRAIVWPALGTAVIFEILKSVSSLYLQSVLGSPAGTAFGPIIGVMVFAYLASRIVLYAAAWSAADPRNEQYLIVDEVEPPAEPEPQTVVLAPVYEAEPAKQARRLMAAAGIGAAVAGILGRRRRGDR
ncbi:YhjD/YihY/BrkB family envelope integrity protein [Gordonia neofelifaecis]|uniref:Ribonuclease BN n=1 Tax=Gordonia neofelifaecis NRRL B-59395 TaxID=644548 RepID=F1YFX3_9ACTN|nr:YhjD/YihY/BrkB family envelope integrity protein [Gordonia neofelifaecis]EGD56550.1 ribonuclease BN [Gordonia neofelifaecis NRRL B-59395]